MRQTALLSCVVMASAIAAPAFAQNTISQREFPVSGNAPQICAVQEPRLAPGGQINFNGLSGNTLQVTQLVDPQTLGTSAASVEVEFDAVCNYPHQIRLETQNNGLFRTVEQVTAAPTGFTSAVPYTAEVTWGDVNGTLQANAQLRQIRDERFFVNEPTAGIIQLRISIEAGASNTANNAPVIAGIYGDTLRLFVEPR